MALSQTAINNLAKELGIPVERTRIVRPPRGKLAELEEKMERVETELQKMQDNLATLVQDLKKLYQDGFGMPYP